MLIECLTVASIYGIVPIIENYILKTINIDSYIIFSVICMVFFCICYILLFQTYDKHRNDINILNKKYHLYAVIFITTFVMFLVSEYLYLYLILNNNTYLVVSIIALYPIITVFIEHFFCNERITLKNLLGVILTCCGVVILTMF